MSSVHLPSLVDWRSSILAEFLPGVAKLTLVADPDQLLSEEQLVSKLTKRGFDLIEFKDPTAFRYSYESRYRSRWDKGEETDLVVILGTQSSSLETLPFDLLQAGRRLSFNLGDLFPNLSYPVVAALDRADLDALFRAQVQHKPGNMGDNVTKDFALRHVFEIAPELIKQPSDLLRVLLRRHYRGQRIPGVLDQRFIHVLRSSPAEFDEWPLDRIVSDREAFFAFLQERWPVFLDRMAAWNTRTVGEKKIAYGLQYSGPLHLPFEHDDIRVYVDNLFLEGLLQSVSRENAGTLTTTWAGIGIQIDPAKDRRSRLDRLIESVRNSIPTRDARHRDWFHFGYRWAEISVLEHKSGSGLSSDERERTESLRSLVDCAFLAWVKDRFAGLHNQPPVPPAMLHHIPKMLAREVGASHEKKAAFLLVDGLALDQWIVLRDVLQSQRRELCFRESAVFAWIPTVTSVSRQAAFAGKPPIYFPASINTTNKEQSLWTQFWADQGLTGPAATYARGLGDGNIDEVRELLLHPRLRVAGLVIDKVDKIMHGMELGAAGMHNQVRQWAMQGFMPSLIDFLLDQGFQIILSSDHGNVEAKGCGRPAEGAVADIRGERVRVYPDKLLRSRVKERFPEAIEWPPLGLPEDYLALLAPHRKAFIREGETVVGHGGISIEELVVPLIQIERLPVRGTQTGREV